MRQKRAKAYKRVMALYVSAFNFRQPYQVLASSDFLVEAGKSPEIDILKMMGTTVQGEIKPMITQCCIEALYRLGKDAQAVVNLAKRCERRKCNHRTAIDPHECLKDVIGETNKHRYVLAVQAQKFATAMGTIPGLPIMHFNARGVLVLSPPSTATVRHKNALEEDRRVGGAALLDGVVDGANVLGGGSSGGAGGAVEGSMARRKAKQPNPLSMKKKKKGTDEAVGKKRSRDDDEDGHEDKEDEDEDEAEAAGAGEGGDAAGRKKKKRRRGKGGKGEVAAAIAEIKAGGLGGVISMAPEEAVGGGSGEASGDESD